MQALSDELKASQSRARSAVKRSERTEEAKRKRSAESSEEREERLRAAKEKRAETKKKKAAEAEGGGEKRLAPAPASAPAAAGEGSSPQVGPGDGGGAAIAYDEDAAAQADVSIGSVLRRATATGKRARGKVKVYEAPLPHHRHLTALQASDPHPGLLPALLRGEASDQVEVVWGPPGTGKTAELVRRAAAHVRTSSSPGARSRALLCAPTNVGASNLYRRCVEEGLGDDVALCVPADRVPLGTAVLSQDPSRSIVCATISGRAGPALDAHGFDGVFVDEAAQCMEAWVWTLLRPDVTSLVLAGDVRQLPACVSETGVRLRHDRSLMERLVVDLAYGNVRRLEEQNRMAPELLAFPNAAFYGGVLRCGPRAPSAGTVEVRVVSDGREERVRETTYRNAAEADAAAELVADEEGAVIITPYSGQVQLLLAQRTNREVHTVDSFQGREADFVVLSVVRDGSAGIGFWEDERRLTVALTRARRRLVVLATTPDRWPEGSALRRLWEAHAA